MFKRKFEEAAEAAPAAPAAADPKSALVEALTSMGLNAEQAEAVFAMAEDLIAAGSAAPAAEEAVAVEASRDKRGRKRTSMRERKRMGSRARRSKYSREGRTSRPSRMSRTSRPSTRTRSERTALSAERATIARQRRKIAKMQRELSAAKSRPAAPKLSSNPLKGKVAAQPVSLKGLSAKERVMNFVNDMI